MSGLEARIAEVLAEAWDAGNCTGLDGWVGPGRGSGEVDNEALTDRQRDTAKLAAMLAPVIREAQAEAWDEAVAAIKGTIGAYTEEGVWALEQAEKLNPHPYRSNDAHTN